MSSASEKSVSMTARVHLLEMAKNKARFCCRLATIVTTTAIRFEYLGQHKWLAQSEDVNNVDMI
jgi:hypothetical protein